MFERDWSKYEIAEEAQFMENIIQAANPKKGEVRFWEEPITKYMTEAVNMDFYDNIQLNIPSINPAEKIPDLKWHLDFDTTRYIQDKISVTSGTAKSGEQYKYRHDFVSGAILNKEVATTDQPLSTILPLKDKWDDVTPDFIHKTKKGWVVIEMTTARTSVEQELKNRHDDKLGKYLAALQARSRDGITYVVIVVGIGLLVSSVDLEQQFVDDLLIRMNIGISIENKFLALTGRKLVEDDQAERALEFQSEIKAQLVCLQHAEDHSLYNDDEGDSRLRKTLLTDEFVEDCKKYRPYDPKVLLRDMANSIRVTSDTAKEFNPQLEVNKFMEDLRSEGRRFDTKCVVNHPLVMPARSPEPTSDIEFHSIVPSRDDPAFVSMWCKAMCSFCYNRTTQPEDPTLLLQEALETDKDIIRQTEEMRKSSRKTYRRVDLSGMTDAELQEIAQKGVWGKKLKDTSSVKTVYNESHGSFHADVSTVDIDQFIINEDLLSPSGVEACQSELRLLEIAENLVGNDGEALRVAREWTSTKLFEALNFMSCAMVEIAISNRQHCKGKNMIMKKVRDYEAYLLINPTKESEHCFVSFYFPRDKATKVLAQLPFKECIERDEGWFCNFVSFKPGKLENKASNHCALLTLASYWAWFYRLPDATPSAFLQQKSREALKMLLLSILIRAEDKESSEFVITQTRYMFMEIFKSNVSLTDPDPMKFLRKLRTIIRSRLTMWLTLNTIKHFHYMSVHPPAKRRIRQEERIEGTHQQEVPARDQWDGLINPLTGGSLETFTNAINIAYLGYLKNKNDGSEGNVEYGLIQKILDQEILLDKTPDCDTLGHPEADFPKAKGFNMESVNQGIKVMQRRLSTSLGAEYKSALSGKIMEALGKKLTEEIASLKASCTIPHDEVSDQPASLSHDLSAGRIKVLEAVSKEVDLFKLNPYFSLDKIVSGIESTSKGIIADIFKKSQHGGLREIFVLTIKSRIVQLFLETISRVICGEFIEETMTHPDSKMSRLDEHMVYMDTAAHSTDTVVKHICSSRDKSKWSQQMMMRIFYYLLTQLLPEYYHSAIRRCLNMWVRKNIKMPQRVQNLLCQGTVLSDESYKVLLHNFNEGGDLVNKKSGSIIQPKTGMMQGILHYTSSLLHVAFLNYMQEQTMLLMRARYPRLTIKMVQVCSSDDSSAILSIMGAPGMRSEDDEFKQAVAFGMLLQEQQGTLCKLFGMTDSEKSAENLFNTIEFNSEFRSENTIVSPIIKLAAASLNLTESESLMKRQEGQYGLCSQLFSSGLPAYNTRLCQLSQGMMHYRTMGAGISPIFCEYMKLLMAVPDPIYGFFLTDVQYFPGLLGLGYSYWKSQKVAKCSAMRLKTVLHNDLEITEDGGIIRSLTIKMGESKKWKAMIERVRGDLDLEECLTTNPSLLFRHASNEHELRVKLLLRACSPSVGKSMMGGNPFIQALAVSVYMLHTHCFTKSSIVQSVTGKLENDYEKTSLLSEMTQRLMHMDPDDQWTEQEQRMMFPSVDRYKEVEKVVEEMRNYKEIKFHVLRNKRGIYQIQPSHTIVNVSLKQMCTSMWFSYVIHQPKDVVNRARLHYGRLLPWLRATIEETLEASPFTTYLELAHFIESYMTKPRKFLRYGPSVATANFQHKLLLTARRSYKVGVLLTPKVRERSMLKDFEVVTKASLAINIPNKVERENRFKDILVNAPVIASTAADLATLHIRTQKLALIQLILKEQSNWRGRPDADEEVMGQAGILNMIRNSPASVLYTYIVPQRKVVRGDGKVQWKGHGEVTCLTASVTIKLDITDDECNYILVNSFPTVLRFPRMIETILRSLMLKSAPPTGHRASFLNIDAKGSFNRGVFGRAGAKGIPVFEDTNLLKIDAPDCRLEVKIDHNEVRVVQSLKPRGLSSDKVKRMTVLSWRHHSSDVSISPDLSIRPKNLYDAWINQQALDLDYMIKIIGDFLKPDSSKCSQEERKWFAEVMSCRLASVCGRDLKLMSRGMEGLEILQSEIDPSIKMMDKSELAAFMVKMIEETNNNKTVVNVLERFKRSNLFNDEDYGLVDFTGTEADGLVEGPIVSDFRRRLIFVDAMIDRGLQESSMFWNDVMSGTMPPVSKKTAEIIMTLLGIKVRGHKRGLDDMWSDSPPKEYPNRHKPDRIPQEQCIADPIVPDDEEAYCSDVCSDSDESMDDEAFERDYQLSLGTVESVKAKINEGLNPAVHLEDDLVALEKLTLTAGATPAIREAEDTLLAIAGALDAFELYKIIDTCAEYGRVKTRKPVTHDGNCWFYSFLTLIGVPDTEENVVQLKLQLLNSRYFNLSVATDELRHILMSKSEWGDDNVTKLASREFGVNICVHIGTGCRNHKPGTYCQYRTRPDWPWIHMVYEADSKYEPLMTSISLKMQLGALNRTVTTVKVVEELLPKSLNQAQIDALRKKAKEERELACMARVIVGALGNSRNQERWKYNREVQQSVDASMEAWKMKFSCHVEEHNLALQCLTARTKPVEVKSPDPLPTNVDASIWSDMTRSTSVNTVLSSLDLGSYSPSLEALLNQPSTSHGVYSQVRDFMSGEFVTSDDSFSSTKPFFD